MPATQKHRDRQTALWGRPKVGVRKRKPVGLVYDDAGNIIGEVFREIDLPPEWCLGYEPVAIIR
jgi:hypothetical protein